MPATATLVSSLRVQQTGPADHGGSTYKIDEVLTKSFGAGTGAGQIDRVFGDARTLSASATENLDLAGGITDAFGQTITFAKVRGLLISADAGNTNDVVVGGAASNAFVGPFADASDKIKIAPGASVLITAPAAGWTVTAGTGDILLVANGGSGTSVTYKIAIVGTSV